MLSTYIITLINSFGESQEYVKSFVSEEFLFNWITEQCERFNKKLSKIELA